MQGESGRCSEPSRLAVVDEQLIVSAREFMQAMGELNMTNNWKPRRRSTHRRKSNDPFDIWLGMVVDLVIEPAIELVRSPSRFDHKRRKPRRRGRCRRRHCEGDKT